MLLQIFKQTDKKRHGDCLVTGALECSKLYFISAVPPPFLEIKPTLLPSYIPILKSFPK